MFIITLSQSIFGTKSTEREISRRTLKVDVKIVDLCLGSGLAYLRGIIGWEF